MKESFKRIKNDRILVRFFGASFIIFILTIGYILLVYGKLPPVLPIFNQLPWGDQRLGTTQAIFLPDLLVFLILIVNLTISGIIYPKTPLLSRMLAVTSFVVSFLTFLFIIRTVQIVL